MIEMELKASIRNYDEIKKKISAEGCEWSQAVFQADTIYTNENMRAEKSAPVFRIRECGEKIYLTLKILEDDINTANEFELEISDRNTMQNILRVLGFEEKVVVKKKRQTTTYRGFGICLDDVEKLGTFIEIEKLSEEDADRIEKYNEMREILFHLNIQEQDLTVQKYYEMLAEGDKYNNPA